MPVETVIRNGKIVTSTAILEAGIAIENGKIVAIAKDPNLPDANRVINARGNLVLPGIIDAHVHFKDPGFAYKEDFETGSFAAAAGGVTMVFDMPNTRPPVTAVKSFEIKRGIAERKSVIDFALIAGIEPNNIDEILKLARSGVSHYKVYMGGYKKIERPDMINTILDDDVLFHAFKTVAKTGLVCSVHAENEDLRSYFTTKMQEKGRRDPLAYSKGRPSIVEAEAVSRAILIARKAGCRMHICHMSTRDAANLVRRAKILGEYITAETCPHYLLLTSKDMKKLGSIGVINPPLRSKEDVRRLWRGLIDGTIDMIVTDHSPHTKEDKEAGKHDIWKAISGFPGVETMLPLMLTEVNKGNIGIKQFVALTSQNPAKTFGIYPQKGNIQVGSDADLIIIDLKKEIFIHETELHSKSKVTPFDGWKVKGTPTLTMVRGTTVMEEGEIIGKPGFGKFIKPEVHNKVTG